MDVLGIDEIIYGVDDLLICCCFFFDWGMVLEQESVVELVFVLQNGCCVIVCDSVDFGLLLVIEVGLILCEVVWGVFLVVVLDKFVSCIGGLFGFFNDGWCVGCIDFNGLVVCFQVLVKCEVEL